MATPAVVHLRDTRANQPAAAVGNAGVLFCVTDEGNIIERSNGTTWEAYSPASVDETSVNITGGSITDLTALEIPVSATPTVATDGEIAGDTTVTDFSTGVVKFYLNEEQGVVAMPVAQFTSPQDGYVVTYDATADEFQLKAPAGGGGASDATDLTYTPSTLADWDGGVDPGDGQEAFDQLAERVTDLEAGSGGGDFVRLAETVTSASASNVQFAAISSSYRNLRVVVAGRCAASATAVEIRIRFNGDTGSNYDSVRWNRFGNNVERAASSGKIGEITGATGPTNAAGSIELGIQNFVGTVFQKSYSGINAVKVGTAADSDINFQHCSGFWRNTAAITQIDIFPSSGAFVDGTVVTLYGTT